MSDELRKKMSISSMGFKHTEEEKLKRSKAVIIHQNGTLRQVQSAKVLADELGLARTPT